MRRVGAPSGGVGRPVARLRGLRVGSHRTARDERV